MGSTLEGVDRTSADVLAVGPIWRDAKAPARVVPRRGLWSLQWCRTAGMEAWRRARYLAAVVPMAFSISAFIAAFGLAPMILWIGLPFWKNIRVGMLITP